jgi:GDP-4-dehydro-6-deoxy-D-mannose reductase
MRKQLFEQPVFIQSEPDCSFFKDKVIGMTGHRGMLGGVLSKRLSKNNVNVKKFPGDILDVNKLHEWFSLNEFDYFFHLAAKVPVGFVEKNMLSALEVNAIGTFNVFQEIAITQKQCWSFFSSTSHVYSANSNIGQPISEDAKLQPSSIYGSTKLQAENFIKFIGPLINELYCIGRIFSLTHISQVGDYLVPSLLRRIKNIENNEHIKIFNPDSIRDILDAETVVDSMIILANKNSKGVVNIGSGDGVSVKDIAIHLANDIGKEILIDGVNMDSPSSIIADTNLLRTICESR